MKSIIIKNERVFVLTNSTCDIFAFNLFTNDFLEYGLNPII